MPQYSSAVQNKSLLQSSTVHQMKKLDKMRKSLNYLVFRYNLETHLYMCEPWERKLVSKCKLQWIFNVISKVSCDNFLNCDSLLLCRYSVSGHPVLDTLGQLLVRSFDAGAIKKCSSGATVSSAVVRDYLEEDAVGWHVIILRMCRVYKLRVPSSPIKEDLLPVIVQ